MYKKVHLLYVTDLHLSQKHSSDQSLYASELSFFSSFSVIMMVNLSLLLQF